MPNGTEIASNVEDVVFLEVESLVFNFPAFAASHELFQCVLFGARFAKQKCESRDQVFDSIFDSDNFAGDVIDTAFTVAEPPL